MAKRLLSEITLKLGRLLGAGKRKEKDTVQIWQDMCLGNNINTSDRLLDLIKWDLQNGGVDLSAVKQTAEGNEIQDAFNQANLALEVNKMVKSFTQTMLESETAHQNDIKNIITATRQNYVPPAPRINRVKRK